MKSSYCLILIFTLLVSCSTGEKEPDAWGNFEATEIIISAESAGKILQINAAEGDRISSGDLAAIIDSSMISLQIAELNATRTGISTRLNSIDAQNRILEQQIENLQVNIDRVKKLLAGNAATQKQLDDLVGQKEVLLRQIDATNTQKVSVRSELSVLSSKEAIIREQLSKCYIRYPQDGTVMVRYSEKGEITSPGRPLIKIADLSVMKLQVFISGAQLSSVMIGQSCTVKIDSPEGAALEFTGRVTRISDKAEFTPKIIQTREERVDLVYAVTIEVANNGSIKSGMPAEAYFGTTE